MAYQPLPAKSDSDTLDLATYNKIKGNFEASAIDIVTTKGDLPAATGPDALARLGVGNDDAILVAASGETTGLAWQIVPACRVYNSGNIDPATSTWVDLTFDSERFDTDGMHSPTTNPGRITIPSGGNGLYVVGGNVQLDTSGLEQGGGYGLRITLNGSVVIAQYGPCRIYHGGTDLVMQVHTLYSLSAGDFVKLQVYTSSDVDVLSAGNFSPEFWAVFQRRQ